MDFEYNDDVEETDIDHFADIIKLHPFTDDDIREVFRILTSGDDSIIPHDMFSFTCRESDVRDARITRLCKSTANHIFRIQFLDGSTFIIRLSHEHSYEEEIAIINEVASADVEVPRNYFSHPQGIGVGSNRYFAMLQEHLPGKDLAYAVKHNLITTGDKEVLLEEMGKRLRRIHSVNSIGGKVQENTHENFLEEALLLLDHERVSILEQGICEAEEFEDIFSKLYSLKDTARIFGGQSFGLTHMDFRPRHVILDLETSRPTIRAIIDWGNADFTNIFFDFALWDYWCGEDFLVDSLIDGYGAEVFSSSESKLNVELTTLTALVKEVCNYANVPDFRATQLGLWQRLRHEVKFMTY